MKLIFEQLIKMYLIFYCLSAAYSQVLQSDIQEDLINACNQKNILINDKNHFLIKKFFDSAYSNDKTTIACTKFIDDRKISILMHVYLKKKYKIKEKFLGHKYGMSNNQLINKKSFEQTGIVKIMDSFETKYFYCVIEQSTIKLEDKIRSKTMSKYEFKKTILALIYVFKFLIDNRVINDGIYIMSKFFMVQEFDSKIIIKEFNEDDHPLDGLNIIDGIFETKESELELNFNEDSGNNNVGNSTFLIFLLIRTIERLITKDLEHRYTGTKLDYIKNNHPLLKICKYVLDSKDTSDIFIKLMDNEYFSSNIIFIHNFTDLNDFEKTTLNLFIKKEGSKLLYKDSNYSVELACSENLLSEKKIHHHRIEITINEEILFVDEMDEHTFKRLKVIVCEINDWIDFFLNLQSFGIM